MKYLIFPFIGCCISLLAVSQSKGKDSVASKQKEWIESMKNYVNIRLSEIRDVEEFQVDDGTRSPIFSPNVASITRLGFSYRFLSLGYKFAAKFLPGNDDDNIRGSTKAVGYDLYLNFSKWQQEFNYSKTKGYYLENTSDFISSWQQGDPYLQFPNLEHRNFQGITGYKFNPNFSFPALVSQTERQLKSAGTFMPTLLYRYYIIDDKAPLTGTNSTQKSRNFEGLIGIGYYHTFVVNKNFYFALGISPAAGLVSSKLTTRLPGGTITTHQNNFAFRMNLRGGAGYNGERFFAGIYVRAFGSTEAQQNTPVVNYDNRIAAQAFLGYRFKAPK